MGKEESNNLGWVSIWRSVFDNPLYFSEPFNKMHAWIDIILLANHKDGVVVVRGNIVSVKRGQLAWSREKLAERWKWSRGKVNRYFMYLESVQQIEQQNKGVITLIKVINYEEYQRHSTTDSTTDGHQTVQQTDTNNKGNKVNNEKKRGKSKFSPPSVNDVKSYCDERRNNVDPQTFVDFYESKGWYVGKNKMKDWKAAVRTWEKRRNENSTELKKKYQRFLPGRPNGGGSNEN